MRAVVPLLTLLAIVGVALIATSPQSGPQTSRGPVRIRATSAGAVTADDSEPRDTLDMRADSAVRRRRGPTTRHQR
ncbi:hypothetical protein [Roseisolibacter agri]|uniref:Uncharacterized protein n=1 Tax=Roseisolibacter agri TaxID=2014610 RepID=A0AA37Q357_9BACT|nr:hypothetical protein [Roseisolibacter agri]GLC25715.1 hypothetical protein rosag_22280 [Roseisolibacter agri]